MERKVQYSGDFVAVELYRRESENIAEIWMRKNPTTSYDDDGNTILSADEVFMLIPLSEAPTKEELQGEQFEKWYEIGREWSDGSDAPTVEEQIDTTNKLVEQVNANLVYACMMMDIELPEV